VADPPLVTGGTGFAGGHLIAHLLRSEPAVAGWAHSGGRTVEQTDPRINWRHVDLLDAHDVARAILEQRPAAIYHCAGFADVGAAWSDPARALAVNVLGTHHVLDGVRAARLTCPVLVTGSALVYRPALSPLREDDPLVPRTPYGITKLAQEMRAARDEHASIFLTRPFNHAGPRQSIAYVTSSFARQIAEIEAGLAAPVLHVGNLDSKRDITDVRDTVRAYQLIVEHGRPHRAYNVCSGHAYRIGDLLDSLLAMSTSAIMVTVDPSRLRPSDDPVIVGDRSRIAAETGWAPEIPIERTLRDLLDYWRRKTNRNSAAP
jgi:GDP-4-dehydro-6-deoxy-D-mannose reductase